MKHFENNCQPENLSTSKNEDSKIIGLNNFSDVIDGAFQKEETLYEENRKKYKIDVNEIIPKPQIAWSLTNAKREGEAILGTLGDFGLVIGKAKSRKSFFIGIAVSTALGKDYILGRFKSYLPHNKNEVIYFDTEQSKYYVQKAVKRICTQIDQPEPKNLHAFHLRSLNPAERLQFIETEIYSNDKIGFVVIDGIKDLVTSINDEAEATMIASKLLKWTEERNIYLVTVLHQNKSDNNARGHIGTELINKAQTVLSVTKAEKDDNISIVEPLQCRDIEPEIFAFEINEFGIPVIAEDFEIRTETSKNKYDVTDLEDFKKFQLLTEVFSNGKSFSYGKLVEQIRIAYKNQYKNSIGVNKTKLLITYCSNNNWLLQEKEKGPYTLGIFQTVENDANF
jgi:predicted ATP-dependent serine protease